ncbi:pilus assembly protein PilM [Desulfosporosinus meridiei]|uniref:Tfp pilus assembly protein, ATPase PilM n=1 Tax=Desulfosporosinus meridiei (strain ATCC BAA-275 / DSM 13257 / KCTC 12902 / NCIMB 13706 / S10) TaxID=768704 RepID=J7IN41_DESMD|nr:pilus assembly protein PilM [Desulfosporosinus meridiei]AFQ43005.1 Tfp pilus assembly protein, ATPase PilM [Desulfosporosinus meridiei DSM 13257]
MFRDNKVLGIDIGTRLTKFALLKQGTKPELIAWGIVPTPQGSVSDGLIRDKEAVSEMLKSAISEYKLTAKRVAVTLHSSGIMLRELNLTALEDAEIEPAVEFELSQSFPDMLQTHATAFKIYTKTSESLNGISTSCPKQIVNSYIELFDDSGLTLKYVDVNANTLAKAYNHFVQPPVPGDSVLIVDLSYATSEVNVLVDGKLILSRSVSGGGAFVDSLIVNRFEISMEEAEAARQSGYKQLSISQDELDSCLRLGYSSVEEQIRQTLDFIRYSKLPDGIKQICLTGGGSNFPGLETYFSGIFRTPVTVAQSDSIPLEVSDKFFILMPAIGAALRED